MTSSLRIVLGFYPARCPSRPMTGPETAFSDQAPNQATATHRHVAFGGRAGTGLDWAINVMLESSSD